MHISIRKGTVADAADLTEIGIVTFTEKWKDNYDQKTLQTYLSKAYDAAVILRELQQEVVTYLIATAENQMIGFAKLSRRQQLAEWITEPCLEVCRIYVLQAFQDHKAGARLMDAAIEIAKEEKLQSVVLGVWENNHRAISFYKKLGFEQIGTHPFLTGDVVETDWVMRKEVVSSE
ncbi:MAG: GNAT family N-acetyltransferase [Chitinophagales bacterium]